MDINKGDRIVIVHPKGYEFPGTVISANNYSVNGVDDWYIELHADVFGYMYWKQSIDRGTVKLEE